MSDVSEEITWRQRTHRPPTDAELSAFEASVGFRFPEDCRAALIAHGGSAPSMPVLELGSVEAAMDCLLVCADEGTVAESFTEQARVLRAWAAGTGLDRLLVPFAGATDRGVFCFDLRSSREAPPVVYVNLDEGPSADGAIRRAARSFTELVTRLQPYELF